MTKNACNQDHSITSPGPVIRDPNPDGLGGVQWYFTILTSITSMMDYYNRGKLFWFGLICKGKEGRLEVNGSFREFLGV